MKNKDGLLQNEDIVLTAIDGLMKDSRKELRLTGPNLVPFLATRCLNHRGTSELRSTRHNYCPLDASTQGVHLKTKYGLLQTEDILLTSIDGLLKDSRK